MNPEYPTKTDAGIAVPSGDYPPLVAVRLGDREFIMTPDDADDLAVKIFNAAGEARSGAYPEPEDGEHADVIEADDDAEVIDGPPARYTEPARN